MGLKELPERNFRIYALYDPKGKTAFLGKSYAKDLGPMYSKHLCGRNKYTKEYFGKKPPLIVPQLCVLEDVYAVYKEAYRHLIAWCRVFLDAGYNLLVQESTVNYATSLYPSTRVIYDTIRATSLDIVLQRGSYAPNKPVFENKLPHNEPEIKSSTVQFNIRIFEDDMLGFIDFCEEYGLTRKEGFSILLCSCPYTAEDEASFANEEIKRLKERLLLQSKELKSAEDKLEKLSLSVHNDTRYQSLFATVQLLLREYCEIISLGSDAQPFLNLKIGRYQEYLYVDQYSYPQEEQSVQIISLKAMLYGRGRTPAIFILAETENKQLIKLRAYSTKAYLGIYIPRSAWSYYGSRWVAVWRRSKDGAVDIVGSLPIPFALDKLEPDDLHLSLGSKTTDSLEDIIRKAEAKKHKE